MHIPNADTFMALRLEYLQPHPEGISEYELLQHLSGEHHPEHGGNPVRLQAIHAAMTILDPRKQTDL